MFAIEMFPRLILDYMCNYRNNKTQLVLLHNAFEGHRHLRNVAVGINCLINTQYYIPCYLELSINIMLFP